MAQCSATGALRLYNTEKQLHKDAFLSRTVQRVADRFLETGSVDDNPRSGRPSTSTATAEAVDSCLHDLASQHPYGHASTRRVSQVTGIPHSTVYKVMRSKLKLFPYKLQVMQAVTDVDCARRKEFANWLLENQDILDRILWTDEANFCIDGSVNTHNCVVWGQEKPRVVLAKRSHSPKVCVWMGIAADFRVAPFFFEDTVDGAAYLHMLQTHVRPELASKRKLSSTIFMQDGAPPHVKREVTDFLRQTFTEERVISRNFRHFWPAYSPDINPLDYYLWGYVRGVVYQQGRPSSLDVLKHRIVAAINEIPQQQIRSAVYHVLDRCLLLEQEDGGHIEQLL